MPEGPEVKLSADLIRPLVVGKTVMNVYSTNNSRYGGKPVPGQDEFLKFVQTGNCKVEDVRTKGKFLWWQFTDYHYLMSTFGMTGQWSPTAGKHPCFVVELGLEDYELRLDKMVFNDPRHFGTVQFANNYANFNLKLSSLGWDPLGTNKLDEWKPHLHRKVLKSSKPIGQLLMEQSIFSGVGNYIRAEALYLSKISPWRQGNLIKEAEFDNLCQSLIEVMNDSYQHQGATIQTYRTAYGEEGKYSSKFKVYGQKQDPLGNQIITEATPDGRTMHWCPTIQK